MPVLEAIHERLARVVIERMPYAEFIEKYDHSGALFYLDPPYYGCEKYYGRGIFERSDFERLSSIMGAMTGAAILSINDVKPIREIFAGFEIREVATVYTGGSALHVPATELLIIKR